MYKRQIWQDHVEGIQEGTDMNAANFNNLEAGTMEAVALAAMNAAHRRYCNDMALNAETIVVEATLTGSGTENSVDLPAAKTRNFTAYNVAAEVKSVTGGTAGDIIILTKQANGFKVKYNGDATSIVVRFHVSGGMF